MSVPPETTAGTLYVVATPIGNLRDVTLRALELLAQVDLVACEDTRHTAHLLAAHGIRKPLTSYFEHNELRRTPEIVARLRAGARVALVSSAGTPAISDPGYRLVRGALEAGCRVVAVPGPCAAVAALSMAGLPTDRFAFEGFLPARAAACHKALSALAGEPRTMVFYESPRRLGRTLALMAAAFGQGRGAALVREITKVFEQTMRGTLGELASRLRNHDIKGEVTLVVEGAPVAQPAPARAGLTVAVLLEAGMGLKQASALVARLEGRSRREVYQQALEAAKVPG